MNCRSSVFAHTCRHMKLSGDKPTLTRAHTKIKQIQVYNKLMRSLHRRQPKPLRNYLYVSDAKLDTLFEQIDQSILKRISLELKVDLKIAGITVTKAENPSATRMAKLRVVEQFIDDYHNVGTCENPGQGYFRGQLDMRWGWLEQPVSNEAPSIVFFKGEEGSSIVTLAGSSRHVIGAPPDARVFAGSALPHIITAISDSVSDKSALAKMPRESARWARATRVRQLRLLPDDAPSQRMEFLAIPLAEDRESDPHVVLGAPICVALALRK